MAGEVAISAFDDVDQLRKSRRRPSGGYITMV